MVGMAWYGIYVMVGQAVCYGICHGTAGMVGQGTARHVRQGTVGYMVWYMVWQGMVWYDMVRYGMI